MKTIWPVAAAAIFAIPTLASAQSTPEDVAPPSAVTVSGGATIASDYRFRGVSQSDREMAVQGGITIAHDSGFHVGTWASNLSGWGTFGGANMELDLIGGCKNLTCNVSYVDTDISSRDAADLRPSFSKGQDGTGTIAGDTVVASLTAAF